MKRRNFLTALALAPLVPVAAKLAALEGPKLFLGPQFIATNSKATNFAALSPPQMKVWSRDLWNEARDSSFLTRMTKDGTIG